MKNPVNPDKLPRDTIGGPEIQSKRSQREQSSDKFRQVSTAMDSANSDPGTHPDSPAIREVQSLVSGTPEIHFRNYPSIT